MVPSFSLFMNIKTMDSNLCETEFRELIAPCIAYVDALKGAFDKGRCTVSFCPPDPLSENSKEWSARCAVMISVGKERGEHLIELYNAIVRLITFELPNFQIQAEVVKMNFS